MGLEKGFPEAITFNLRPERLVRVSQIEKWEGGTRKESIPFRANSIWKHSEFTKRGKAWKKILEASQ